MDTIVTFQEYMLSLEYQNRGFSVTFLRSNQGRITGCIWQTEIMRNNFEQFGLLDSILPTTIGVDCYNLISDHLKQMIYSKTKEGFDSGYKVALDIIQNRDQQHDKYEMSLHKFAENKDTYAL